MDKSKASLAPLFLFMSALFWSFGGVITKLIPWHGITVATIRGIISFALCLVFLEGLQWQINKATALYAFCYFSQSLLFISAHKYTTAANATVLHNTSPLYIILFNALIYKRMPGFRDIGVAAVLFLGVILAVLGNMAGGGWLGNALALASAVFYAAVFFLNRMPGLEDPMQGITLGNAIYLFLIPLCLMDGEFLRPTVISWAAVVFMGFLSFGAWLLFSKGISQTPALTASFITMSEPVMSPVWTYMFLGEKITRLSLLGCALVILTLLFYNIATIQKPNRGQAGISL